MAPVILSSWKEIAAYLKISVKTAQRNKSIPVHRISEKARGRVIAYQDELDAWVRNRGIPAKSRLQVSRRILRVVISVLLFVSGLLLIKTSIHTKTKPEDQPADFQIIGSELIILNNNKTTIGRFDTKRPNLEGEDFFRAHFQTKKTDPRFLEEMGSMPPHLIYYDIGNDGFKEILIAPYTKDEFGSDTLYCLKADGKLLWEKKVGKDLVFGTRRFKEPYVIKGIGADDLDGDGRAEIVVFSNYRFDYPAQILVLDYRGRQLGEYWNSGQINDMDFMDLNGDGRKEIFLAGQNEEYENPSLIVLDVSLVRGASPQNGEFQCRSLEKGTEKYYVRFPLTIYDKLFKRGISISWVDAKNYGPSCWTSNSVINYIFDGQMHILDAVLGDAFRSRWNLAWQDGRLKVPVDLQREKARLIEELRYFDGMKWVSGPAMSNAW